MSGFCLYKAEGGQKMWLAGEINVDGITHLVYSVGGCGVKVFRTFAEALGVKQKLAGQGEDVHISTDLPRRH